MLSVVALRDLLDYTAWASRRLVDAAAQLSPDQLTRDFGTADKSVLGTLVHVFGADRVWLLRVEGKLPQSYLTDADYHLPVLQQEWPVVQQGWHRWLAGLTDATATAEISYSDMRGNRWRQPGWQIVLHVVNHATHHRGQVSGFLRTMGHAPPTVDLSAFYRTRGQ